jgi:hypothetical protein
LHVSGSADRLSYKGLCITEYHQFKCFNIYLKHIWFKFEHLNINYSPYCACGVVRLSPLGMSATVWPIVPALDDG